jgi:hypothetical protein
MIMYALCIHFLTVAMVTMLEAVIYPFLSEKHTRRNWKFLELFHRRVEGKQAWKV